MQSAFSALHRRAHARPENLLKNPGMQVSFLGIYVLVGHKLV